MRGLFWFLGLCFLAVAIALLAHYNNGVVFIVLPPWRIDFSLNFLIVILFLGFILAHVLLQSLRFTLKLPARARAWREKRQREQADATLMTAIRLLFEGRFGHALRQAEEAWRRQHAPGIAALLAARSVQHLRQPDKVAQWLARAREAQPETAAAASMIDAETAVEQGDFHGALARLATLQREAGRHIAALRLELRARQKLGDTAGVLKLVRQLEKRGGLQAGAAAAIRQKTHAAALVQRQNDAAQLLDYFGHLRREERTPQLAHSVAASLRHLGKDEAAAELIETTLSEGEWSSDLAALYGQLGVDTTAPDANRNVTRIMTTRIARAEAWLGEHPGDSRLLLALGRLCERQQLWGKAKSCLEASLALSPCREAYLALARLQDALGETRSADRLFRQAAECDN
ncbi:MAG: heme biosynthesis protein HemY [Zoogloeaceae bacterium]|jgi:HemY protein|nr:heme biosynthesis protein HemY [Zoogloeaceae bacterium]